MLYALDAKVYDVECTVSGELSARRESNSRFRNVSSGGSTGFRRLEHMGGSLDGVAVCAVGDVIRTDKRVTSVALLLLTYRDPAARPPPSPSNLKYAQCLLLIASRSTPSLDLSNKTQPHYGHQLRPAFLRPISTSNGRTDSRELPQLPIITSLSQHRLLCSV